VVPEENSSPEEVPVVTISFDEMDATDSFALSKSNVNTIHDQ
jgi:hypothetical protein